MALARVDGEIGASTVESGAGNALVEAVFANEVCALRAGAVKEVKLIDVRAHFSLAWYRRLPIGGRAE